MTEALPDDLEFLKGRHTYWTEALTEMLNKEGGARVVAYCASMLANRDAGDRYAALDAKGAPEPPARKTWKNWQTGDLTTDWRRVEQWKSFGFDVHEVADAPQVAPEPGTEPPAMHLASVIETVADLLERSGNAKLGASLLRDGLKERKRRDQVAPEPPAGDWIAADDYHRNVRALDVALNGEDGAAARPLLIDVLSQVEAEVRKLGRPLLAPQAAIEAPGLDEFDRLVQENSTPEDRAWARDAGREIDGGTGTPADQVGAVAQGPRPRTAQPEDFHHEPGEDYPTARSGQGPEAAIQDRARLDWLIDNCPYFVLGNGHQLPENSRDAIDAAMKEGQ